MAITNGYITLAQFKSFTAVGDNDDTALEITIESASRAIDNFTGRHFYQDAGGVRVYTPDEWDRLEVDDIYNTTSLALAQDTTGDGTFDTTWTITTDFLMHPPNPRPGWPYTAIVLSRTGSRYFEGYPNEIELTANYGWSAVPEEVRHACLIQTNRFWHRRNSPEGVAGFSEFGVARISKLLDPDAQVLLDPFRKMQAII